MIGAGSRANQVIYPAFSNLRDSGEIEISGICDIYQERLTATADKFGIDNRYGEGGVLDYQRMVAEQKPDAAIVVGQPHIMYDIWKWCLENGLHLYIEKPLALTIHQARALTVLAQRGGLVTQVSLQRRYSPMVTAMRDECLKRGELTHMVCKFYKNEISDFLGARDHMMDDTVHSVDTLRWMAGCDITKIESMTRRVGTADINFIMAQLTFSNGAVGHLMNNWSSGKRIFAVEMHAPGIFAEAEHETNGVVYADGDLRGVKYTASGSAGSDEFHITTGVLAAATDFVRCCLNGGQPMSCFADAVKTMKAAEIILAQSLLAE